MLAALLALGGCSFVIDADAMESSDGGIGATFDAADVSLVGCPESFTMINERRCFREMTSGSFGNMADRCRTLPAYEGVRPHAATLDAIGAINDANQFLLEVSEGNLWVGLVDVDLDDDEAGDGDFRWITGAPYSADVSPPVEEGSGGLCVRAVMHDRLARAPCSEQDGIICEWDGRSEVPPREGEPLYQ